MKKTFRTFLTLLLLVAGTVMSWADFKDFSVILNNASGTLLTAEEQVQGTEFTFGVAVDEAGAVSRVDAADASSVATISGKYWNDHGSVNVKVTVPVKGNTKVVLGNCTYGGHDAQIATAEGTVTSVTTAEACWKNDHSSVTEAVYEGKATTLTITGAGYCPYVAVEAMPVSHTWDFTKWSATTVANLAAATEWSNDEKNNGTTVEGCYWQVAHGTLTANGAEIAELQGLEFTNTNDRALALATNYPSTSLGEYAGPQYLWLGGKNMAYFTIKNVKVGSTIKMGVESHKPADPRGVTLTNVAENPAVPTTYTEQEWTVTGEGDVVDVTVTNTNGCHIYWIDAETVQPEPEPTPGGAAYDNVEAQITWAVGNETRGAVSEAVADAVLDTKVSVGTDLNVTSTNATYTLGDVAAGPYVTYQPLTGNPGTVPGDMIEYSITMKKGLTFKPTSVEFDAVKEGTDGAYFSWSYTIDGVEGEIVKYSDPKTQIRRNNNANPTAPLTHQETITAEAGRKVTLRFYISNVASDKKMSIGNIKINGEVSGTEEVRSFKNFKIDFRSEPYTVVAPEAGLPEGVEVIGGSFHGTQHGYQGNVKINVPVDGPVAFTFGGCRYNNGINVKDAEGNVLATIDVKSADCDNTFGLYTKSVSWTYNSETAQTLTIEGGDYLHFLFAEACELLPMVNVEYYNTNGKLIGSEEIQGGSALAFKYGEADVTVGEGKKFRGWFTSDQATALKVAEGTIVQDNIKLYAKATPVEVAKVGSIFTYPLNSNAFYIEDHECISSTGKFHDTQHGFEFGADQSISVNVAGNAVLTFGKCCYGNEGTIVVTDAEGNQVGEAIDIPIEKASDGAVSSVSYNGPATTLNITLTNGGYIHNVTVYNVEKTPAKNAAGYYEIAPNDAASLQLVLAALQDGDKVYLPNGTYDFGEKVLTTISAKNVSIIGESMEGTIIRNCPPKEQEGIGTTATLLNTSDGLYLQDLTIQNALDYYATGSAGRAVCLQDKGSNTICKNVKMLSYQDTYYSNKASNFYWEDSEIHGTVDYLCGDGDVVYNRCKFVNESRAKDSKSGSDVLAAPYTSAQCTWGYVFLDCSVESQCKDFTFARSWGGESKAQFIRTTILDGSLNAARFTVGGMNVAAYKFTEFGTKDANGTVTTPASNVIKFTHSSGDKEYETVLSADEAAKYTVANIYGTWAPDVTCQQVTELAKGQTYLVNGAITTTIPAEGSVVRIANSRGGFGPEVTVTATSVNSVSADAAVASPAKFVQGSKIVIAKDNKLYNVAGAEIK